MRKDAPLAIDLPGPDRDRPRWVKVGIIAAVGFVIGVAWPRVMGVRLGPSAPSEMNANVAAAAASSSAANKAAAAPAVVAQPKPSASVAASASAAPAGGPPNVMVQKGSVLGCKGEDGESKKGKECGGVAALDQIVAPRLKKLSSCGAADGQTGKLSFVVNANFTNGSFSWDIGKSSTVTNTEGLTTCLKTIFQGVTVQGVAHENPRYTVAYATTLTAGTPSGTDEKTAEPSPKPADTTAKPADTAAPTIAAGGEATVSWEVALIRDTPKTGTVVARLPRGTKVKVGAVKDGWYTINYGDGFASSGFVYHSALGK